MPGGAAIKAKRRSEIRRLVDLVQRAIDAGATSVEQIHKQIADLPLDVLERLDVFEQTVKEVRRVQDTSIGAVYDVIRKVNQEAARLATEMLRGRARPVRRPAPKTLRKTA
jgi:hypothetical protein